MPPQTRKREAAASDKSLEDPSTYNTRSATKRAKLTHDSQSPVECHRVSPAEETGRVMDDTPMQKKKGIKKPVTVGEDGAIIFANRTKTAGTVESESPRESNTTTMENGYEELEPERREDRNDKHELETLLDRTIERLQVVESFGIVSASRSGQELKSSVETFNCEVMHCSATITELVSFEGRGGREVNVDVSITSMLARQLVERISDDDTLRCALFRRSLQAIITGVCRTWIERWFLDKATFGALFRIYEKMRKSESPSVSGRWKILTRKHSKDLSKRAILKEASEELKNKILLLVGLVGSLRVSSDHKDIKSSVRRVLDQAMKVDQALMEAATDEEWEVFHARAGERFNEKGNLRDGGLEGKSGDLVLCPVGLGLRRASRKRSKRHWLFALKAEALLKSDLTSLDCEGRHNSASKQLGNRASSPIFILDDPSQ
ncbi:hypothetical protein V5O48_012121 [Marasmius crinis-equi]|uniref:Uncharacterized protein n=1 Tax=Marasmius crinis-equi TaxID=585013 RepID=A0ABR3F3N8_9AGAR